MFCLGFKKSISWNQLRIIESTAAYSVSIGSVAKGIMPHLLPSTRYLVLFFEKVAPFRCAILIWLQGRQVFLVELLSLFPRHTVNLVKIRTELVEI